MIEYKGKYRILCEWDRATLEPIKDDTYITCSRNGQIYRVNGEILAYYRPTRGLYKIIEEKLKEKGVDWLEDMCVGSEVLIYFKEYNLNIIADYFGAKTNGADISPWSVRNLRREFWFVKNKQEYIEKGLYSELSEEEREVLREKFKETIN